MRKISKYLAAVFAVALLGAFMAGCSGQASSGSASASGSASGSASASASASSSAQPTDELIAELEACEGPYSYKSVTITQSALITMNNDDNEASTAESASSASADASSSSSDEINIDTKVLADFSGDKLKAQVTQTSSWGSSTEVFLNGNDAVYVADGDALSATAEELDFGDASSAESFLSTQGAAGFADFKDKVKSIEKTDVNGEVVYTVTCDAEKLLANIPDNGKLQHLELMKQLGIDTEFDSCELYYRVNAENQVVAISISLNGAKSSLDMTSEFSDIDATTVPDAPEPTGKLSDVISVDASSGSSASSEASAA